MPVFSVFSVTEAIGTKGSEYVALVSAVLVVSVLSDAERSTSARNRSADVSAVAVVSVLSYAFTFTMVIVST
jgi:hypothetical protein